MTFMSDAVQLTPKGERWRKTGHPWIYRDDVQALSSQQAGKIVRVLDPSGKPVGQALCNPHSKIALRWLTDQPDEPLDRSFWQRRLEAAIRLREAVVKDSNAYRLIYAEADGFPGLIVDRYDRVLVVQCLSLGMEQLLPHMVEQLIERLNPQAIVLRHDASVRRLEGLPLKKEVVYGHLPNRLEICEGPCRFWVDVWEGQKTGAYLDQRENRLRAGEYARGRKQVLDLFSYQGAFALQVARYVEGVLAVEDSLKAVEKIRDHATLNGLKNIQAERANVFHALRRLEKEGKRFDLVILDPPAFAKNRQEIADAQRGYREINLRAMRLLGPRGILITCSCSFLIGEAEFLAILRQASADAARRFRVLEIRTQAQDHPILVTHPEGRYLKCVVLEAI
jgi:23S rRNA (cytosine1962-C5)-methyltransferase